MFELSRSFIAGAKIIMTSDGINNRDRCEWPHPPVTVCCALAIEVALKALLTHEDRKWSKKGNDGHNLKLLFDQLPERTREEILLFQASYTKLPLAEAEQKLEHDSLAFVHWRYAYEHAILTSSPAFLHDFAVALSEYIHTIVLPLRLAAKRS